MVRSGRFNREKKREGERHIRLLEPFLKRLLPSFRVYICVCLCAESFLSLFASIFRTQLSSYKINDDGSGSDGENKKQEY